MRKRTSIIWTINKNDLQRIIDTSNSYRDVLRKLEMSCTAGNFSTLKKRIIEDNVNIGLLDINRKEFRKKQQRPNSIELLNKDIFVENSSCCRGIIKKRIFREKLIPYKCEKCSVGDTWENEKLVLVLDHKNGINNDHRLENLRFLCPNCNSQTSTFAGKNCKKKSFICPICKLPYVGYGKQCRKCWMSNQPIKFNITKEKLETLLKSYSLRNIGKMYNVSGNTVKNKRIKFGISI